MAKVEIHFIMPDGEKRKDIFHHFENSTESSCKCYWLRGKPKEYENAKIIKIIIENAFPEDDPMTCEVI